MLTHVRVTSAVITFDLRGGAGWAVQGGDAVGLRHHQPRAGLPLSLSLFTPLGSNSVV